MQRFEASNAANAPAPSGLARRALYVGALLVLAAVCSQLDHTVCPFANLVGQPCPGCGMTRAALALLQFDLNTAFRIHPMSPIGVPLVAFLLARGTHRYLLGQPPIWAQRVTSILSRWRLDRWQGWLWGALVILTLGIWGARFLGALGGPVDISPQRHSPLLLPLIRGG